MMLNGLIGKIRLCTGGWILSTLSTLGKESLMQDSVLGSFPTQGIVPKVEEGMFQMT